MSDGDSGVDAGSESDGSVSMSVESSQASDDEVQQPPAPHIQHNNNGNEPHEFNQVVIQMPTDDDDQNVHMVSQGHDDPHPHPQEDQGSSSAPVAPSNKESQSSSSGSVAPHHEDAQLQTNLHQIHGMELGSQSSSLSFSNYFHPYQDSPARQDNSTQSNLHLKHAISQPSETTTPLEASGSSSQPQTAVASIVQPPTLTLVAIRSLIPEEDGQHDLCQKMRPGLLQRKKGLRWKNVVGDELGEKKLRIAANAGDVDAVRKLLDDGVDPKASDSRGRTALHFCAAKGNTLIARMLIDAGANTNQKDIIGNLPLHLAACNTNVEIVTLLLEAGTDPTALDNSGRTAIHLAQSRLRLLQKEDSYTSEQIKEQMLQVLKMMRVYAERSGTTNQSHMNLVSAFSSRIQSHNTKQEVDHDLQDLLSNLSCLSLTTSVPHNQV